MTTNEAILELVDRLGGGYVWEDDIFAVTLEHVPVSELDARRLCNLVGVKQIAINARCLDFPTIEKLSIIHGLESLVLFECSLSDEQVHHLRRVNPRVEIVLE
jgi:hypothetical protein